MKIILSFLDDSNGIGCGYTGAYSIWANGKAYKEKNEKLRFKTTDEISDYIMKTVKENREKGKPNDNQ